MGTLLSERLCGSREGTFWCVVAFFHYFRLLNASDEAQTWGGGGGTWVHGTPGDNAYWPYLDPTYDKNKRLKNNYKKTYRAAGKILGHARGLRKFFRY